MNKFRERNRLSHYALCLFVWFFCSTVYSAQAQEEPGFVRFIQGDAQWQGELQTAIVTFVNDSGVELNLVAAVHLGEEHYYAGLNDFFSTQDVVLYELVAEADQIPLRDGPRSRSVIGLLQQTMADFLQVGFQLNEIDYSPSNFLHADLTPSQLDALMASKNENFLTMFLDLAMAQMSEQRVTGDEPRSPFNMLAVLRAMNAENQNAAFKYLLAAELGRSGGLLVSAQLEQQLTLLGDRNQAALRVLDETLEDPDKRSISIFYGAAHMPGIERAITVDRGFSRQQERWLPAWVVP
ncbi:MAG: hypothetical protein WDZ52_11050 [Pseudohongiellaceae bacterium]